MNILKYISSLSFVTIVLLMQPHCSIAITPQEVINQYARNLYPGNVLSYWNCYDQIVVLKNGDFYKNQTSDIDAKLRQVGETDGKDVIFIPIEDIIGFIAEDPTYPDKILGYMRNQYRVTNNGLKQTINSNLNPLNKEEYKKTIEKYLNKSETGNATWCNWVYNKTGIEKNRKLFEKMEKNTKTDLKKLTGTLKENVIHNEIINHTKKVNDETNLLTADIKLQQASHTELQIQVLKNMYNGNNGHDAIIEALLPKVLTVNNAPRDEKYNIYSLYEACNSCAKTGWLKGNKSIFMFKVLDHQWIPEGQSVKRLPEMMSQSTLERYETSQALCNAIDKNEAKAKGKKK